MSGNGAPDTLDVVEDAEGKTGTVLMIGVDGGVLVEYQLSEHVWKSDWRDPSELRVTHKFDPVKPARSEPSE